MDSVTCKRCGFVFEFAKKPDWADSFEGCFCQSYCEKNQENPKNKHKYTVNNKENIAVDIL